MISRVFIPPFAFSISLLVSLATVFLLRESFFLIFFVFMENLLYLIKFMAKMKINELVCAASFFKIETIYKVLESDSLLSLYYTIKRDICQEKSLVISHLVRNAG